MDVTQDSPAKVNQVAATAVSTRKRRASEPTPSSTDLRASKKIAYEPASSSNEDSQKASNKSDLAISNSKESFMHSHNTISGTEIEIGSELAESSSDMTTGMAVAKPPINCKSSLFTTYRRFLVVSYHSNFFAFVE